MGWVERTTAVVAGVAIIAAVSAIVARSDPNRERYTANVVVEQPPPTEIPTPLPPTPAPPPATPTPPPVANPGALVAQQNLAVHEHPDSASPVLGSLDAGVIAPVLGRQGRLFQIMTPHEVVGWVDGRSAEIHNRAGNRPGSLEGATIVIDPGHGGHLDGARGPTGYVEKDANRDTSLRMIPKLAGARVFLTRLDGHAGLRYRALVANQLGAHAFVSVHNNAMPNFISDTPGTEIYHQINDADSRRLAGLLYEELYTALSQFQIQWGKNKWAGARPRRNAEGGDYYAVLRHSEVPAVIVEGMFIATPAEEALLRLPEVHEIKAEAMARALHRYFATSDPGAGFQDPYAE